MYGGFISIKYLASHHHHHHPKWIYLKNAKKFYIRKTKNSKLWQKACLFFFFFFFREVLLFVIIIIIIIFGFSILFFFLFGACQYLFIIIHSIAISTLLLRISQSFSIYDIDLARKWLLLSEGILHTSYSSSILNNKYTLILSLFAQSTTPILPSFPCFRFFFFFFFSQTYSTYTERERKRQREREGQSKARQTLLNFNFGSVYASCPPSVVPHYLIRTVTNSTAPTEFLHCMHVSSSSF